MQHEETAGPGAQESGVQVGKSSTSSAVVVGEKKTDNDFIGSSMYPLIAFGRLTRNNSGDGFSFTGMSSGQLAKQENTGIAVAATRIEQPLVDPVAYRELYRRDATHRACVDAKTAYAVGQGWRLRPVSELFGNDQFAGETLAAGKSPDIEQRKRALEFLCASEPEYSLTQLLTRVETDCQSEGNGYIEVARGADGEITRFYYVPAETMRILEDYTGFMQVRGQRKAFWARYGTGVKAVLVKKSDADDDVDATFIGKTVDEYPVTERIAARDLGNWYNKAGLGEQRVTSVNEMMHFSIFTPRDTNYGEPCIISAIEAYLGNQNMQLMTLSYFDRCGVPRLAIVVEGDELSDDMVKKLKEWASSQDKMEAMNEVLVLQVPPGANATFAKLSSEQLHEASFLQYHDMNDSLIMRAHRTPESILATAANSNRAESMEANNKFITGVVRPRQEVYMSAINYLLRHELGVTDWVFDLNVPNLESEKTKAEIAEIGLRGGSITINEVRQGRGQQPLEGGDEAHRAIPGTGLVFVSTFGKLAAQALTNGPTESGVAGAAGQKTPAKGTDVTMGTGGPVEEDG